MAAATASASSADSVTPFSIRPAALSHFRKSYFAGAPLKLIEKKFSIGWGIVGLAIFGPLGALAGAILGGDNKTRHVVAAQLENGLRFVVQLDQDEFVKWVNLMPHKEAPSGEEV